MAALKTALQNTYNTSPQPEIERRIIIAERLNESRGGNIWDCSGTTSPSSSKSVKFGDPEYESTLIKWYDELEIEEGEEAPKDLVQHDDSSSENDMDEGNEEEDGEDSVVVVLIDHSNDKDNNEANDDEKDQSTSNKKNPSLEKIVSSGRLYQFLNAGKHLFKT
ncbi:hypothetical protein HHI36_017161 [Cryptolaemus montrouzieri]|uniref:Uncharacterized protein n=1 Tax=Cryptolaemus montrouzieri TaxID=559131 RepID=A0ABD2NM15_9CUCU